MITPCDFPLPLPDACRAAACWFDPKGDALANAEQLGIALPDKLHKAVGKRRAEFLAGRYCARQALQALGGPAQLNIRNREDRSPVWPRSYLGSITHSQGFAAAAVAAKGQLIGLGIDTERRISQRTAENVSEQVLTTGEQERLSGNLQDYLTVIFSAKESLFKCLHPLVQTYFGFDAAQITFNPEKPGQFTFQLTRVLTLEFPEGYTGTGHFRWLDEYVHTCVVLEPSQQP